MLIVTVDEPRKSSSEQAAALGYVRMLRDLCMRILQNVRKAFNSMAVTTNLISRLLVRAAFVGLFLLTSACATHVAVGYRVYDPYYGDYHVWSGPEIDYYNTWLVQTHRPHRDYRRLRRSEQREYWAWRHRQPGRR